MSVKEIIKPFIPPALLQVARRLSVGAVRFSGDYDSWETASRDATGYDASEILNRVVSATRKVVAGEAVFERDSVLFDQVQYSWPLLASLLQVALERGSLRVVDFGGSLGSTWRQNRTFLERLGIPVSWHVVEQPHFVNAGRAEFSNDTLRFYDSISDAGAGGADVALFASSLGYVPDARRFLREIEAIQIPRLIIDRLPMASGDRDRIALQNVSEPIYTASYPVRLFERSSLLRHWLRSWRLIESWNCDLQADAEIRCSGFFLEKR
ncbi:MAG: methyltransferase, TIGR04325 family [Gammaproteobacteria bacterium]